ncbi:MAG: amidohydrolase family protein [Myxococcota bacterium]
MASSLAAERFTGRTLLPSGAVRRVTLTFEGVTLVGVDEPAPGEADLDGLLIPGLVNAHTHLELSDVGLVPGGHGLPAWVRAQMQARRTRDRASSEGALQESILRLMDYGTSAVCDVAGGATTAPALLAAGLSGVVQRERLGQDPTRAEQGAAEAVALFQHHQSGATVVVERPTAHAPYSTHPDLARAVLARRDGWAAPATIHLAEDPAELQFLHDASGPFAALLTDFGVRWAPLDRAYTPMEWLASVSELSGAVAAVHGVELTADELSYMAKTGTAIVLCARSNLHIGGKPPPVASMLAAGVPLALGTDGLVSCPDLDVLGEVVALCGVAPEVPVSVWLHMATRGGAQMLGFDQLGAFELGSHPGLVQLDTDEPGLRVAAPDRRWLVRAGVPSSQWSPS